MLKSQIFALQSDKKFDIVKVDFRLGVRGMTGNTFWRGGVAVTGVPLRAWRGKSANAPYSTQSY